MKKVKERIGAAHGAVKIKAETEKKNNKSLYRGT